MAALDEGREVMHFGTYGGSMRGGNSDSTIVVGDRPILTPPTVTAASFAIGMHPQYWPGVEICLRPGAVALINSSVFREEPQIPDCQIVPLDASTIATDMGVPRAATMIVLGALAAATNLVGIDSLAAAVAAALPSYRQRHAEENAMALRAGFDLIDRPLVNAWDRSREGART
jgi:Pyruvate/2-oxoacid:ferredoxin oxidoreductase gamma subunit